VLECFAARNPFAPSVVARILHLHLSPAEFLSVTLSAHGTTTTLPLLGSRSMMSSIRAASSARLHGHVGRHAHDGARRRADGGRTDRQGEGTFEDQHERVERRRVFSKSLPRVEGEEREIAPAVLASTRLAIPCSVGVMSEWNGSALPGGIVAVVGDMRISCSSRVGCHAPADDDSLPRGGPRQVQEAGGGRASHNRGPRRTRSVTTW
jgi:hypothetical protein